MKLILVLFIAILSFAGFAQDTIPVPQVELDGIIEAIDTLVEQDSINNLIILSLETEVKLFETIIKQTIDNTFKVSFKRFFNTQVEHYDFNNLPTTKLFESFLQRFLNTILKHIR